jgi:hypothetical protein
MALTVKQWSLSWMAVTGTKKEQKQFMTYLIFLGEKINTIEYIQENAFYFVLDSINGLNKQKDYENIIGFIRPGDKIRCVDDFNELMK